MEDDSIIFVSMLLALFFVIMLQVYAQSTEENSIKLFGTSICSKHNSTLDHWEHSTKTGFIFYCSNTKQLEDEYLAMIGD